MKVYQVANNFLSPRNDTYSKEKFRTVAKGAPRFSVRFSKRSSSSTKIADQISITYRGNLPGLVSNVELTDKQMNFSTVIAYTIQLSPDGEVNSGGYILRRTALHRP